MIEALQDVSWVLPLRSDSLTAFMKIMPFFASMYFFIFITTALRDLYRKPFVWYTAVILIGSALVVLMTKYLIAIPRPTIGFLVPVWDTYGFPSGDVCIATVCWGLVCYFTRLRAIVWLASLLLPLIAFSRIYLGAHTTLDVLGGFLFGGAIIFGAIELWNRFEKNIWPPSIFVRVSVAATFCALGLFLNQVDYLFKLGATATGFMVGLCLVSHTLDALPPVKWPVAFFRSAAVCLILSAIGKALPSTQPVVFCFGLMASWLIFAGLDQLTRIFTKNTVNCAEKS